MSEFSVTGDDQISAPRATVTESRERDGWFTRPVFLGLSIPWLACCVLVIGGAAWYLFAPEGQASTQDLAFSGEMVPVNTAPQQRAVEFGVPVPQAQDDLVDVIAAVKAYAEANRTGIERLSETVKAQSAKVAATQQQLLEAQAQVSLLSARLSKLESKPAPMARRSQAISSAPTSPLAGMRLSAIQADMAWVYWQDRTWAVQVGDDVGPVTITGIDANARQVRTSGGVLK